MAQKVGIAIGVTGMAIGLLRIGLGANGVVIALWLSNSLVGLAIIMFIGGWLFALWNPVKRLISGYTLQPPITKSRRVNAAVSGKGAPMSDRQRELLDYYERQKENWKSNLHLRIIRVMPTIDRDVPKVIFEMEMVNYLPIEIKLVRVAHSSGSVNASVLGSCELPALPETIDERINACSERQFPLQMEVGKTNVPDFLRPKLAEPGQLLQWTLKGEWYVEIDGKIEVWATQSYQLMSNQVVVRQ